MPGIAKSHILMVLSFCFLLASKPGRGQTIALPLQHLSEGLSHNNVRTVYQDREGYLWVGTLNGLNRYNGLGFEHFLNDRGDSTSLPDNSINTVLEDRQGYIWIATEEAGLARFDRASQSFMVWNQEKSYARQLADQHVNALCEDRQGNLWIATKQGLNVIGPERGEVQSLSLDFPDEYEKESPVYSILEDTFGRLWLAKREGIFLYLPQDNKILVVQDTTSQMFKPGRLREMLLDTRGQIWMATNSNGVFKAREVAPGVLEYQHFQNKPNDPQSLASNRAFALCEDHLGRIWLGMENGGVHLYNPEEQNFYRYESDPNDPNTLRNNSIWEIYEDPQQRLWIGTFNQGLSIFDPNYRKFSHIKQNPLKKEGLQQNSVTAFWEAPEGQVWIATDGGGLTVWDPQEDQYKTYLHDPQDPNSISSNAVLKIMQDKKGHIWLAVFGGALNRYEPDKDHFVRYEYQGEKLQEGTFNEQFGLDEDSQGRIWVAPKGWGAAYWDPSTEKFHVLPVVSTNQEGIHTLQTSTIFVDSRDQIWVGNWGGGINRLIPKPDGTFEYRFYEEDPDDPAKISNGLCNQFYEDQKGRVWIATKSKLNLFDPESETFQNFGKSDGLLNEFVNSIVQDKRGDFWVSTNQGLFKMHENEAGGFEFRKYDKGDGLQGDVFIRGASYRGPSGRIYVGGTNGFNYFLPEEVKEDTNACPVVLTGLKIFNRSVAIGLPGSVLGQHISQMDEITLSYEQTVFTIEYVGLNLTLADKNTYAYRLIGFDKAWNEVGSQKSATYTNLDAGEYIFEVKAANHDGVWSSEISSLKIRVLPPWWETWWFRTLIVLLVLTSAYSFYQFRINRLKKNQRVLEEKVEERTRELTDKHAEIQTQAEELYQQTEELATQRDYIESKNQELALKNQQINNSLNAAFTIQHSILPHSKKLDRILKDYYVVYRPKDVVSGDFYWLTSLQASPEDTPTHFLAAVDCTGHGIPGAFMTLIGNRLLDKIVRGLHIYQPSAILYKLHEEIRQLLRQDDTQNNFGMDMVLISWKALPSQAYELHFCGAKNDLYYIMPQEGTLGKLKGDRRAIGGEQNESVPFLDQQLILPAESLVFLGTDGLMDQNDPKRKRFGRKRLEEMLSTNFQLPLETQKELLEEALDGHKLGSSQRDDILWMGFRLKA